MPGNFEVLTKGVFVEPEIQLNNKGYNLSPWHNGEMQRILVKSENEALMERVVWTCSPQEWPGL